MMTRTKDRFRAEHLYDVSDRPRKFYAYYVTGPGEFPLDMLRHDSCWPATTTDALKLVYDRHADGVPRTRSVQVCSYKEPSIDRWLSFGWSVGTERLFE
jgi:hypothetical protein